MMPEIDLVIFDCDGVIVDSEMLACRALADALAEHGLAIGMEEVFDRFLGRSFALVEAHYRERSGRPLPGAFGADLGRSLERAFQASLRPIEGVKDVIAAIGRPCCVASSSDPGRLKMTLEVAGLAPLFDDRVYSASQVANGKPAPDLFLFAAGRLGAAPRRCLVVEDTVPGVIAGKAAGMMVWGFTGGSHCTGRDTGRKLAEAGADRVFDAMPKFFTG